MNDWYVINDYGDIAESNLSEINAKLLAEKLNKKVWYISDVNSQYMISYDNKATNDFDQVEKYETEKDALNALEKIQNDFVDKLVIAEYQDNSNWKSLCDD